MNENEPITESHSEIRFVARSFGRVLTGKMTSFDEALAAGKAELAATGAAEWATVEVIEVTEWVLGTDDLARKAAVEAHAAEMHARWVRDREVARQVEREIEQSFGWK